MRLLLVAFLIGITLISAEAVAVQGFVFFKSSDGNGSICKQQNGMNLSYRNDASSLDSPHVAMAAEVWNDAPSLVYFYPPRNQNPTIVVNSTQDQSTRFEGVAYNAGGYGVNDKILCSNGYINLPLAITLDDYFIASSVSNFKVDDNDYRTGVIAHEFGHTLGLGHTDKGCSLMSGVSILCNTDVVLFPTVDEVRGLVALYGWAADYDFQQKAGQTYPSSFMPPSELQVSSPCAGCYADLASPGALPNSKIAVMMGYVTPKTLYRFGMEWTVGDALATTVPTPFARMELDNDGSKFVYWGSSLNVVSLNSTSPTLGSSYFLELAVEQTGKSNALGYEVRAHAYVFRGSPFSSNGAETLLGHWSGDLYYCNGCQYLEWAAGSGSAAGVWTDSSSNPASDYELDHFWNFQGDNLKSGMGDFSMSSNPTTLTLMPPVNGYATLSLTAQNNFAGTMFLSTSVGPASGLTVNCNPSYVTLLNGGTVQSSCTFVPAAPGNYSVSIVTCLFDCSISGIHIILITVHVQDFGVSTNPASLDVIQGSSSSSTVSVSSLNGFAGTVGLGLGQLASGITGSLAPSSVTVTPGASAASTLSMNVANSVVPGQYSVGVIAGYQATVHFATVRLNVLSRVDFSISASPSSVSLQQGYGVATQIILTSVNGFSGSVQLTATPNVNVCGFTALFPSNPQGCGVKGSATVSVASGGSTSVLLTVAVCLSTPPGAYSVAVSATGNGLSHTATIPVQVLAGPGCGGGSVAAGTLITLANRTQVPVQNLAVGMLLLSYNMTSQQYVITTINKFTTVQVSNLMIIQTSSGSALRVDQNPAQKVFVKLPNGTITLMSVTDLQVGFDLFQALTRTWVPITGISYVNSGTYVMYDIYTTAPGNYIANGYLDPMK